MSRATRGTARKIATQRGWSRILRCMKATLTTAAAVLLLLAAAPASAGPTDQLREYTEQVIKVLDDPALARQDRRAAVRKIAHEAFDVTEGRASQLKGAALEQMREQIADSLLDAA